VTKQPTTRTKATQASRRVDENASPLLRQVQLAARRRCDGMQDGLAAREQMRIDVLATPAELLPDLLAALSTVRITRADLFLPIPTQPERTTP